MTKNLENQIGKGSIKLMKELEKLKITQSSQEIDSKSLYILYEIRNTPEITVSQISRNLNIHISTISRITDELMRRKFVKESDSKDLRKKLLRVTKKAANKIIEIEENANEKILESTKNLAQKDLDDIVLALRKFQEILVK